MSASLNVPMYDGFEEDLELLIEMNLGDYVSTLADQIDMSEDTQESLRVVQRMITVLYQLGESAGINVEAFDVDHLKRDLI